MIRTINEEPCEVCQALTNAYDQLRGRLCPSCAGVSEPLIDHSEDIEVSAHSYHISNAFWEKWLETARLILSKPHPSINSREELLHGVQQLLYETAVASAKFFALKKYPYLSLPNKGARKDCTQYSECLSRLDWKTNQRRTSFSLKSCPHECGYYSCSYSVWACEKPAKKCPLCGSELPEPKLEEVRTGSTVMPNGKVGIPFKAMVAICPNENCGYAYIAVVHP